MYMCTHAHMQQIANIYGCSSSQPLDDVMILQGPSFAMHVYDEIL